MMFLKDAFLEQPRRNKTHELQLTSLKAIAVVWRFSKKSTAAIRGILLIITLLCGAACSPSSKGHEPQTETADSLFETPKPESPKYTEMEQKLLDFGLQDIAEVDSTIGVQLVYATPDNFLGHVLYPDIHHAFMISAMAQKLVKAQQRLKAIRPDLSLLIYDAARPLCVQREMWASVKGTPNVSFVANPAKGRGMHNYGAAVDITIMDSTGTPLPMGSKHDYFGPEARIDHETELVANGLITKEELENRKLLRRVMTESGFITCISEWWHFNHIPSIRAKEELKIIDF